jgi:hypothetical protein
VWRYTGREVLVLASILLCAILLFVMYSASNIGQAATAFVLYHAIAEMVLSVTDAQLGCALATDSVRRQPSSSIQLITSAEGVGDASHVPLLVEVVRDPCERPRQSQGRPKFGPLLAVSTAVSMAMQDVLQLFLGPSCANAGIRSVFLTLAVCLVAVFLLLVPTIWRGRC